MGESMAKVLEFSVRTTTPDAPEAIREAVEKAFGVSLSEGDYDEVPGYVTGLLGMTLGLFYWGNDILLETRIEDRRFLREPGQDPLDVVRISEAVADMLTILGPYRWRTATDEDRAHDQRFADEFDRRMAGHDPSDTWLDDV
jgi:hypothetical protein